MMNAAAAQLARFYKLPIYNTAGPSESKIPDSQSAYEPAHEQPHVGLGGANYIHDGAGLLESGLTISLETTSSTTRSSAWPSGSCKASRSTRTASPWSASSASARRKLPGRRPDDTAHAKRFFYPDLADRKPAWSGAGGLEVDGGRAEEVRQILAGHSPSIPLGNRSANRREMPEMLDETGKI